MFVSDFESSCKQTAVQGGLIPTAVSTPAFLVSDTEDVFSLCYEHRAAVIFSRVLYRSDVGTGLLSGTPAVNSPQRETKRGTHAGGLWDQSQPEGIIGHFLCFVPSSYVLQKWADRQSHASRQTGGKSAIKRKKDSLREKKAKDSEKQNDRES